MFRALTVKEVAFWWDTLKKFIKPTLGSVDSPEVNLEATFTALLSKQMLCWVVIEGEEILGTVLTQINKDTPPVFKCLLISGFNITEKVGRDTINEGFRQLNEYAKAHMCSRVIAFVEDQRVVRLTKMLGFDTGTTLVDIGVDYG